MYFRHSLRATFLRKGNRQATCSRCSRQLQKHACVPPGSRVRGWSWSDWPFLFPTEDHSATLPHKRAPADACLRGCFLFPDQPGAWSPTPCAPTRPLPFLLLPVRLLNLLFCFLFRLKRCKPL